MGLYKKLENKLRLFVAGTLPNGLLKRLITLLLVVIARTHYLDNTLNLWAQ